MTKEEQDYLMIKELRHTIEKQDKEITRLIALERAAFKAVQAIDLIRQPATELIKRGLNRPCNKG